MLCGVLSARGEFLLADLLVFGLLLGWVWVRLLCLLIAACFVDLIDCGLGVVLGCCVAFGY